MQDEVESKTLTLIVSGTKFTGRLFKAAIMKYLVFFKARDVDWKSARAGMGIFGWNLANQRNYLAIAAAGSAVLQRNFLTFFFPIIKVTWKSKGQKDAEM